MLSVRSKLPEIDVIFAVVDIFESVSQLYLQKLQKNTENIRRAVLEPPRFDPRTT
jgi:hypothetical protein